MNEYGSMQCFPGLYSLLWLHISSTMTIACREVYGNTRYTDHNCVPATLSELVIWHAIDFPQCEWRCLRIEQCRYLNYNVNFGQCELGFGRCESLVSAPGVFVNAFGPARHTCLHWASDQQAGMVLVKIHDGYEYIAVVRAAVGNALVLGKFTLGGQTIYYIHNSQAVTMQYNGASGHELLMADPGCTLSWVSYTPHTVIPSQAVMGGRLADGSPTYVVTAYAPVRNALGYYDSTTGVAHYEYYGPQTSTNMTMLILL